ncbi:MAG: hypothetical protein ABI193_23300, partial [Minicystis sp.]
MTSRSLGLIALLGLIAPAALAASCSSTPVASTTSTSTGAGGSGGSLAASCHDLTKDGDETDLDCGGSCSPAAACNDGLTCAIDADCKSLSCDGATNKCVPAACDDTTANGDETDVDCGGSCAPALKCDDLLGCLVAGDCKSGVCADDGSGALKCAVPECGDNVVNQASELCD